MVAMTHTATQPHLSASQRELLTALATFGPDGTDGAGLAGAVHRDNPNLQGLHQTAASLVRRHMAERYRWNGHVRYAITPNGRKAVA